MSRLHSTFERLRQQGRKALIPYVTAGYPYAHITPALMHVLVEAGVDVIELGVPFSDPSADGPTIQASTERALRQGIGLPQVLDHVRPDIASAADDQGFHALPILSFSSVWLIRVEDVDLVYGK